MSGAHRDDVSGYPVQYAKVQPPPLREETLARHRLLDWLAVKIHHRVILVLADAGYGKTTLLADFAGRTRLRTLWYRLDEDDRDWISLLSHLVASGREADPAFAPNTATMLADTSLSGPTRDTVIEVFKRELQTIAPQGAVLIFDDFHLVDDAPDAQLIAREIVAHAPERLTIVFASRRTPTIPLAKLRATGEVAELSTDDLRFDVAETEQLFRDTYHRDLEPDVLADVAARTEGWAASLQLVHAALRDRTPGEIRGFVRSLTGGDHELYDYLAEEVIGDLPMQLQRFLMQTSILQVVTAELAEVASGLDAGAVSNLMTTAERLTLLGRRARGPRHELRYHPLVREFLETRLARDHGEEAVRNLHRIVATHAETRDWRIAAHHLWAAGDRERAFELIDASAKSIIGRGEYLVAAPFISDAADDATRASFEVVLSRRDFKEGDVRRALSRAERAVKKDSESDIALANLASLYINSHQFELGVTVARRLVDQTDDAVFRAIGNGLVMIINATLDGDLLLAIDELKMLASHQHDSGDVHFEGVTYLNLADCQRALGDVVASTNSARRAIELLESSSAGHEVASARANLGWDLAHLGDLASGRRELELTIVGMTDASRFDTLAEAFDMEVGYGSVHRAEDLLNELSALHPLGDPSLTTLRAVELALRHGRTSDAVRLAAELDPTVSGGQAGHKSRALTVQAHALVASGHPDHAHAVELASAHALQQSAFLWAEYCRALRAVLSDADGLSSYVRTRARLGMWPVTRVAEQVVHRLNHLDDVALVAVSAEAELRPERWRSALRQAIDHAAPASVAAARLLDKVGEIQDVERLRRVARQLRGGLESSLGRGLARRLASPVFIEDQGRVTILVGDRVIEGASIRRKVLALLCFLLTRTGFSATRDEVMDAIWPDLDPGDALNSLNQTVYFLRRVFEPTYKDDLSPGYVHHESDLLWLDPVLVHSRSQECRDLLRAMPSAPKPDDVARLAHIYRAPFALDFAYEEWSGDFRSSVHSAYLQVIERAVTDDIASGHFERGIEVVRQALEVAPDADHLELSLLQLFRLSGSYAAAAEQYSHYAATVRETLGIEPPELDSL